MADLVVGVGQCVRAGVCVGGGRRVHKERFARDNLQTLEYVKCDKICKTYIACFSFMSRCLNMRCGISVYIQMMY